MVSETFTNNATIGTATFTVAGSTGTATDGPVTFSYDAATQGYTLSSATGSITFLPANIDAAQSNAGAVVYSRTNGSTTDTLTLTRPGTSGPVTYTYVGAAFWQRTTQVNANQVNGAINAVAYGAATANAAVPRTGQATFAVDLIGARTINSGLAAIAGSGTTLVDFANGSLITVGRVTSGGVQNGLGNNNFSSSATLSSSANSFSGTFKLDDFGTFNGTINGRLFGPNAEEIGASIRATYTTDLLVATITGRRGSGAPANSQFNDNSANINLPVLTNSELFRADAATISTTLAGTSGSNNAGETFSGGSRSADALSIFYDSAGRSYTLIAPDRTQSFFPTDYRVLGATSTETLAPGARTVTLPIAAPSVTLTYTRAGNWIFREGAGANNRYRLENFVYGIATADSATPRTGSANFRLALNATFADADFPNLINASGTGVLEANFATGAIRGLGTLGYREDYTLAGRAPATPTGNFDLTATLASSANRFNGTINLNGIGSYTGALTGRFYGPAAEELGASFSVSDGGSGIGAGTIVGARDATATVPAPATALLSLTGPTALANSAAIVGSSANAGTLTAVSFDPTTNRYVLGFSNSSAGGSVDASLTLDSASRDAAASTASLTAHSGTFRGAPYSATVSVPGSSNPTIALTYTGFATMNYNIPMFRTRYFAHYGVATPSQTMPQTGSASYNGVISGYGLTTPQSGSGTTTEYNLSGTGTLTANFATASVNSTMNITGTVIGGTATQNFGAFTHNGSITQNTFFAGVNRDSLSGRFYGPTADEFAALFGISRLLTAQGMPIPAGSPIPPDVLRAELDGVFVGRRTTP